MKKVLSFALLAALLATPALASDKCDSGPQSEWRPQAELESMLTDQGWTIRRVKTDEGCYEVYATDKDGKRHEVYYDPKTFAVVEDES